MRRTLVRSALAMGASVAVIMAVACSGGSGEAPGDAGRGGRDDDGQVGVVGSGGGGRYPSSDGGDATTDVGAGATEEASTRPDAGGGSSGAGSSGGSGSSSGSGASSSGGSGSSSGGSSGGSGGSGSGGDAGRDSGADGSGGVRDAGAPDGDASIGIVIGVGTTVSVTSLEWILTGPQTYFGTVDFGDATFTEFVIGGVVAGEGYTITLLGEDAAGDPCRGTSSPFDVHPGELSGTSVVVSCTVATDADLDGR